jgi:hypothetical protein
LAGAPGAANGCIGGGKSIATAGGIEGDVGGVKSGEGGLPGGEIDAGATAGADESSCNDDPGADGTTAIGAPKKSSKLVGRSCGCAS